MTVLDSRAEACPSLLTSEDPGPAMWKCRRQLVVLPCGRGMTAVCHVLPAPRDALEAAVAITASCHVCAACPLQLTSAERPQGALSASSDPQSYASVTVRIFHCCGVMLDPVDPELRMPVPQSLRFALARWFSGKQSALGHGRGLQSGSGIAA